MSKNKKTAWDSSPYEQIAQSLANTIVQRAGLAISPNVFDRDAVSHTWYWGIEIEVFPLHEGVSAQFRRGDRFKKGWVTSPQNKAVLRKVNSAIKAALRQFPQVHFEGFYLKPKAKKQYDSYSKQTYYDNNKVIIDIAIDRTDGRLASSKVKKTSGRNLQWAGIDTRSLGLRASTNRLREVPSHIKQEYYADFGKVIEEWWSYSNNWIKVTRNGLKADANNGAYSIEMKSDLTVYVGGAKKQFKIEDSLYEIILWVDQQTRSKFAKDNTLSLRSKLVRLAYENPSLRADILPLITKSAKGDYKKGDKIPPKSVYGSKDSYDEKLKDGKIFVVLPRNSKNSDPYMMYLTDKSLKVLKVLGTHPSLSGAKSWLKSQKGKLS